jgi:hypothetical protein
MQEHSYKTETVSNFVCHFKGSLHPYATLEVQLKTGRDPAPSTHTHFANVGSGYVLTRLFDAGQSEQDCSPSRGEPGVL